MTTAAIAGAFKAVTSAIKIATVKAGAVVVKAGAKAVSTVVKAGVKAASKGLQLIGKGASKAVSGIGKIASKAGSLVSRASKSIANSTKGLLNNRLGGGGGTFGGIQSKFGKLKSNLNAFRGISGIAAQIIAPISSIFKEILEIIWKSIRAFLSLFVFIFQGFFGFFLYSTKKFIKDMREDGFPSGGGGGSDGAPGRKELIKSGFTRVLTYFSLAGEEVRTVFQEILLILSPLIAVLGPAFLFIGILFVFAILIQLFYPVVFFVLDFLVKLTNVTFFFTILVLNQTMAFLSLIAPTWNIIMSYLKFILVEVLRILCNPGLVFSGNLLVDCPVLDDLLQLLVQSFNTIVAVTQLLITIIGTTIPNLIEQFACPGGACQPFVCTGAGLPLGCSWQPLALVSWLADVFIFTFENIMPLIKLIVLGFIDLFVISLREFTAFISLAGTGAGLFSALITNRVAATTFVSEVGLTSSTINDSFVRDITLWMEEVTLDITQWIATAVLDLVIIVDALICNIFVDLWNCGAGKMCRAIFQDITICIDPGCVAVLTIPLSTFCNTFGLIVSNCRCDHCKYKPPLSEVAQFFNLLDSQGRIDVPCNLKDPSCVIGCASDQSLATDLIPFNPTTT